MHGLGDGIRWFAHFLWYTWKSIDTTSPPPLIDGPLVTGKMLSKVVSSHLHSQSLHIINGLLVLFATRNNASLPSHVGTIACSAGTKRLCCWA